MQTLFQLKDCVIDRIFSNLNFFHQIDSHLRPTLHHFQESDYALKSFDAQQEGHEFLSEFQFREGFSSWSCHFLVVNRQKEKS
jgi:hypothetical protein